MEAFINFDFLKFLVPMFSSDDVGFSIELINKVLQFTIDSNLQILNIDLIMKYVDEYYQKNVNNVQQCFVTMVKLLTGSERVQQLT